MTSSGLGNGVPAVLLAVEEEEGEEEAPTAPARRVIGCEWRRSRRECKVSGRRR